VLASRNAQFQFLAANDSQTFLAAAVITMALTPALISLGPRIVERFPNFAWRRSWFAEESDENLVPPCSEHVIICGFGVNGRNVARILRNVSIDFVVLEMNPITVRTQRAAGVPIFFGDCSRAPVLEHVGIDTAKVLVLAISDPATTRRAVQTARSLNPHIHILVRTRYLLDVEDLRKLGADEIVPEELETSIEIFSRLLEHYGVPRNVIWDHVERLRSDHYEALRDDQRTLSRVQLPREVLSQLDVELCLIRPDSPATHKSLREVNLRAQAGATLIAVRRAGEMQTNPAPDFVFEPQDVAILLGDREQLDRALLMLDPSLA
jgi:CPA2 family monovalent cation:H+ antiporter-2